MKMRYIIRRAARSLRHAKVRTLLTSLAIAVGAFTLTLSLAAGEGSRQYADRLIGSNINPKALFIVKDKAVVSGPDASQSALREYDPDVTNMQGQTYKQLTQKDIDTLRKRSDIENVQPTYQPTIRYFAVDGSSKKYSANVMMYDSTVLSETAVGELPPRERTDSRALSRSRWRKARHSHRAPCGARRHGMRCCLLRRRRPPRRR